MIDWSRALAWRLARQGLVLLTAGPAAAVVDRVVALRGWPFDLADLAVGLRQTTSDAGGLERALAAGDVIRSYAFRGGSYVFRHDVGAVLLACRTATRVWQTRRYQDQGRFALDDWRPFREAVLEVVSERPATRQEIGARLARIPALRHLAVGATGVGSDSLYKPLHWWGDICFGPPRDGQTTFRRLVGDPRWPGLPDVDDAGRRAIELYLAAYGPATADNLVYWLTDGLSVPRRRLVGWIADLKDAVTTVRVGGKDAYVLAADVDELHATEPSESVRLLSGFDPWVFGPGTADRHLIAPERRSLATKGARLVIRDGVVSGTWRVSGDDLAVSWFEEAGPPPVAALRDEAERLSRVRGREAELTLVGAG